MSTTAATATNTSEVATPTAAATIEDRGAVLAAWFGFLFGTGISVGGNVLATWLPKLSGQITDPAWTPGLWPQVGAAVWPIALLLSVEVLTRTTWRAGALWTIARLVSVFTVALGGAVISYGHLHEVLTAWRYPAAAAFVGPLVIDGLMLISGFALLSISKNRKDPAHAATAAPQAVATDATADRATTPAPARRTAQANRADRPARRGTTTRRGSTGRDKARAHWDAEMANGRMPSGADLARIAGKDESLGRRWRRDWENEAKTTGVGAAGVAEAATEDRDEMDGRAA